MNKLLLSAATAVFIAGSLQGGENKKPMFYCGFENPKEVKEKGGQVSSSVKFIDGKKGKALDLGNKFACYFPTEKCLPQKEGTLSAWIRPNWKLRDLKSSRARIFAVVNVEQKTKSAHLYNYFCILGNSYGNPEKGAPYQLYCLIRETKQEQGALLIPDASWEADTWQHVAVSWRIGTGKKDGEFKFYLNGKMLGRRTDFRAVIIEMGKRLACAPRGAIDELKIWNGILSLEEIQSEYSENK